jgi:hypothetical protein
MAHGPLSTLLEVVMRKLLLFTAIVGAVAAVLKRQRDRELDEAVWEEPRDLKPVESGTTEV